MAARWIESVGFPRPGLTVLALEGWRRRLRRARGRVRARLAMLKLGVNIDHVATLREARYRGGPRRTGSRRSGPDLRGGGRARHHRPPAGGSASHPGSGRGRLREVVRTRLNLEMANTPEIVAIALSLKPDIVCLVPERRRKSPPKAGWTWRDSAIRCARPRRLNDAGIEVSLFIGPEPAQVAAAARTGSQFVELHTGAFAEVYDSETARARNWGGCARPRSWPIGWADA